jgi:hypothetical protein
VTDPSFFAKALDWAIGGLTVLIATVWGALHVRIGKIEKTADSAVSRTEWDAVRASAQQDSTLLRADIKQLFTRDDDLKDHINDKIDALRTDMHQQFQRIVDKMDG